MLLQSVYLYFRPPSSVLHPQHAIQQCRCSVFMDWFFCPFQCRRFEWPWHDVEAMTWYLEALSLLTCSSFNSFHLCAGYFSYTPPIHCRYWPQYSKTCTDLQDVYTFPYCSMTAQCHPRWPLKSCRRLMQIEAPVLPISHSFEKRHSSENDWQWTLLNKVDPKHHNTSSSIFLGSSICSMAPFHTSNFAWITRMMTVMMEVQGK